MPAHLRPPERHAARRIGALSVAVGIALLVVAAFSGRSDEPTTQLVRPATESSTEPTVLGADLERTTLPHAPPASAVGFTTTTTADGGGSDGQLDGTTASNPPPPTIGPAVSVTRPPPPRPTTTTASTTTTTEGPTTTEAPPPTAEP